MINMEVSDNNGPGVSFHIPLHRLVAQFIHTLITTWPNQLPLPTILNMIGKPKTVNTFATVLLDYVLQIHVCVSTKHVIYYTFNNFP